MTPNTASATQADPAFALRGELPFDFAAFASPTVVMTPAYVESPITAEQLPFLFWLCEAVSPRIIVDIGASDATAYFGLCQAADQISLETTCYLAGVTLDPDAAENQAKLTQWTTHQNNHHGNRSQLIGGNHENLAKTLEKGSVDLLVLHAAGVSTEQIRQWKADFLPKLSSHAAVFIDGLGDGSHQIFDELATLGPSFRFHHGTGFGVVAPGKSPPELVQYLSAQAKNKESGAAVSSLFQRLGLGCRQAVDLTHIEQMREQLHSIKEEISGVRETSGLQAARLVGREAELLELRGRLDWHREELEGAQRKNLGSRTEINRLHDAVEHHQAHIRTVEAELKQSREATAQQEQTLAELKAAQAERVLIESKAAQEQQATADLRAAKAERALIELKAAQKQKATAELMAARDQANLTRETHIAETTELTRICEEWRARVADLEIQLRAASDNIRRQRRARHQVSIELKGRIRKLQADLHQAQSDAASRQKQVDELLGSTSWKITRSIRRLKRTLTRKDGRD